MAEAATTTTKTAATAVKRAPYRYRPPKKPFVFTPWMLVRPVVALLAAALLWCWASPLYLELREEEYSSRAVQKGRVLLRGAQLVATQQLIDGRGWEETQQYLCTADGWQAAAEATPYTVEPVAITRLELDKRGLIVAMDCVLINGGRRYQLEMDIPGDQYLPKLLEVLEPPPDAKKE